MNQLHDKKRKLQLFFILFILGGQLLLPLYSKDVVAIIRAEATTYAGQNTDEWTAAFNRAKSLFGYGSVPSKAEVIADLQEIGYSTEIATTAANQAYAEYEVEQQIAVEQMRLYLANDYYSQDKLFDELMANHEFEYFLVLDVAAATLKVDWKQQAQKKAEALLEENPRLTGKEITIALQDAWFHQDEITYALRNVAREVTVEEVRQAVIELEAESYRENLEQTEYLLSQLADSEEKEALTARVEKVQEFRKRIAVDVATELMEETHQSKEYLIVTVETYGFTRAEAVYAVETLTIDWREQALGKALWYIEETPDSRQGTIDYLTDAWNFTEEEAIYSVNRTQTNWNSQAKMLAEELLTYSNYSEQELQTILQSYDFTAIEAKFGARSALGLDPGIVEENVMVTVLNLNLRSINNDTASPTIYVPAGSQLEYLETTKNDWFKLKYQDKVGYTHRGNVTSLKNYYSDEKPKIHQADLVAPANYHDFIVVIDANLRTNDADRYRSISLMPEGSKVTHMGTTANDWFKVRYGEQEGYIHRGDVTSVANYYSTATTIHAMKLKEKANHQEFVSIIDQNLRTGDTNQYRSLSLIKRGDSVTHLGTTTNGWFKVDYQGTIGYIYRGDLTSRKNYDKLHE